MDSIRNIIDPRTVKSKTEQWYRKKATKWIKTVERAYRSVHGNHVPWDGVRGYSDSIFESFEGQLNDDQKIAVRTLYRQIYNNLFEMLRDINPGPPQNDCTEDQIYAYVVTALKYKTNLSYKSGYDLWCAGGVITYQSFYLEWNWYVHYGEGMREHRVFPKKTSIHHSRSGSEPAEYHRGSSGVKNPWLNFDY